MAIGKAVMIGAIAALAVPWAMHGEPGKLGDWMQRGLVEFSPGSIHMFWSWPLFCVVTLFAWGFLAWAER